MIASHRGPLRAALLMGLIVLTACEAPDHDVPLVLTCNATAENEGFLNLDHIPSTYALVEGENLSPPLQWTDGRAATAQWALVFEDRDTVNDERIRWVIYNLPAYLRELPAGIPPGNADLGREYFGARQGRSARNSTQIGYRGPNPARRSGVHRYRMTLYALDAVLEIPAGVTLSELEAAIQGHVLTTATLDGKYGQPLSAPKSPDPPGRLPDESDYPDSNDHNSRGPGPPEPAEE